MKISIIVPLFNNEKYVSECLESIKNQTYSNLEVIVVDNESSDNSYEIAKSYCLENNWKLDVAKNIYPHSWNEPTRRAMEMLESDSEWFTIVAADDIIEPGYIENYFNIVKKMQAANINVRAIQTPIRNFSDANIKVLVQDIIGYNYKNIDELKDGLLEKCVVNTPTVFWESSLISEGMMETHPEKFYGADDYWMYCNQVDKGLFIYPYPKWIGYNYRWSISQNTWDMVRKFPNIDKEIKNEWKLKWM